MENPTHEKGVTNYCSLFIYAIPNQNVWCLWFVNTTTCLFRIRIKARRQYAICTIPTVECQMLHVEGHQYKMLSTLQHEDFPDDSDSTRSARDENEYIKVSLSWMTYDRMQKTTSHAVGFNMMKSHLPACMHLHALLLFWALQDLAMVTALTEAT